MGALDAVIMALMVTHAIDIGRLEASERQKVLDLLQSLQDDLTRLLNTKVLSEEGKKGTNALLNEISSLISGTYSEIAAAALVTARGLSSVSAEMTAQAMQQTLSIAIGEVSKPSASYLESLAKNLLVDGSPLTDWWGKQAGDVQFRLAAELRKGMAAGETNQQIIYRIMGKKGEPGVMDIARKNAAALVQTSTATVANRSRLETFRKNQDIMNGVRWLATLDNLTCETCANLDGQKWDFDGAALPGTTMPYMEPPAHVNCRCVMTSVLKPLSEVSGGALADIAPASTRVSMNGSVKGSMTFPEWFAGRTPEQQDKQFGAGKAAMYRAGKITLRDMVDGSGAPLTLAELKALYGG